MKVKPHTHTVIKQNRHSSFVLFQFSLIAAAFIGLASFVLADEDGPHFFSLPPDNSEFHTDDKITFVTNGITNDFDESIIAKLYSADDDTEIKIIGTYTGDQIVRDDDQQDWTFDWVVDEPRGSYYVRLWEVDADGGIDDDDEWDHIIRSYNFQIREYDQKKKRGFLKRSRQAKRALRI